MDDGNNDIRPTELVRVARQFVLKFLFQIDSNQTWLAYVTEYHLVPQWFWKAMDIINKPPMWHRLDAYHHRQDDSQYGLTNEVLAHYPQIDGHRLLLLA